MFGLFKDPDVPIVAFIGRLAYQKGIDVLASIFPWLMNGDHEGVTGHVQVVMMGTGDEKHAQFLRGAEGSHKGRVVGYVGFTSELEHKIIAGADILIMPSRYEPCGLPQMYAQRYGTIPVVHATGGLRDSVVQYDPFNDEGTGWKFDRCDAEGLKYGLWNALNTYKNHKEAWAKVVKRAMTTDFSWKRSAKRYVEIFKWAKMDPPYQRPHPFHTG
jgi:starch synthase